MKNKLIVNSSPHIKSVDSVTGIMLNVLIALIPATIIGIYLFSYIAAIIIVVSIVSCVLFEALYNMITRQKQTIGDLSAVVTGLILALNLPPSISSIWLAVIGSLVAIVVIKMLFGGIGQNIFNPAAAARVFLTIAFTGQMTTWVAPGPDGITSATPLTMARDGFFTNYFDLFMGNVPGSIGETSAFALLLGLAWLLYRKIISWHVPTFFVGTVALFAFLVGEDPIFHVLTAGLLIGAIFMATDYTTSPITKRGKVLFGIGCGVITMAIRLYGNLPEGTSFAILFMNILVPLIDRYIQPKTFGEVGKNA